MLLHLWEVCDRPNCMWYSKRVLAVTTNGCDTFCSATIHATSLWRLYSHLELACDTHAHPPVTHCISFISHSLDWWYLIDQRVMSQGFLSVESLSQHLLYRGELSGSHGCIHSQSRHIGDMFIIAGWVPIRPCCYSQQKASASIVCSFASSLSVLVQSQHNLLRT